MPTKKSEIYKQYVYMQIYMCKTINSFFFFYYFWERKKNGKRKETENIVIKNNSKQFDFKN